MKKIYVYILVFCIICIMLAACGVPDVRSSVDKEVSEIPAENRATLEGEGFRTAEDAVGAYLTALKEVSIDDMLSTFALETYVDQYDFEAQLSRVGGYSPNFEPGLGLPAANDFIRDMNLYQRVGSIVHSMQYQYMTLFTADAGLQEAFSLESDSAVRDLALLLGDPAYMEALQALEVVEFIAPEEADHYASEANQENLKKLASIYGADEIAGVTAHVKVDGKSYLLCFDTIRYGDTWYVMSLSGNIGALLGIPVLSGGVLPFPQ